MARCTFTWVHHDETLQCEIEDEHPQYPGDNGGTVDWHISIYTNENGSHTVGYCDPSLA